MQFSINQDQLPYQPRHRVVPSQCTEDWGSVVGCDLTLQLEQLPIR